MKFLIVCLLIFLSFVDGKADPAPPASNVTVNVKWEFDSGFNVTVLLMTIVNLKSAQYAAVGFGQNVGMVSI